jgi:hypothetical protein
LWFVHCPLLGVVKELDLVFWHRYWKMMLPLEGPVSTGA